MITYLIHDRMFVVKHREGNPFRLDYDVSEKYLELKNILVYFSRISYILQI
jgi:hypothetical protein